MRIILTTVGSLFVSFIVFWTVKFWGRSQIYVDYQHPLYAATQLNPEPQANQSMSSQSSVSKTSQPLIFIKPTYLQLESALATSENIYLDVYSTEDGRLVALKKEWNKKMKPLRYAKFSEVANEVILLTDIKNQLVTKRIIFNIAENAQAGHAIFFEEIKKMNLEKGDNFIVTSPYEAIASSLKELAPAFLYGTTQPEIAKITAMKGMGLIEALTLRADVILFPLRIRKQKFYDEELLSEMKRRHKRIIIGPIDEKDLAEAFALNPFGVILNRSL